LANVSRSRVWMIRMVRRFGKRTPFAFNTATAIYLIAGWRSASRSMSIASRRSSPRMK
jgi:hypothetical protein